MIIKHVSTISTDIKKDKNVLINLDRLFSGEEFLFKENLIKNYFRY